MSKLEKANSKIARRSKIQEAVLLTLASGGKEGPSLISAVINFILDEDLYDQGRKKDIVKSAASRLQRKGLVVFDNDHYRLSKEGEKLLAVWTQSKYRIPRPKRWDGKWRVVIFDIPEKRRRLRLETRKILSETGFRRLQDSVWVYPYECEDMIGLMKTDLGIGKYVLYLIVDQIENDRYLRMDFGLL